MPAPGARVVRESLGEGIELRPGPGLREGLLIPEAELSERFSRSSGPGGQSVNTADSRVELRWSPAASGALTDLQRSRVVAALSGRMVDDEIAIVASEHRSQRQNRVAARDRLAALLAEALVPPPPARRPTKPSRRARESRVESKKHRGQIKAGRGRVRPDD
jgi:ribosome-associated protein